VYTAVLHMARCVMLSGGNVHMASCVYSIVLFSYGSTDGHGSCTSNVRVKIQQFSIFHSVSEACMMHIMSHNIGKSTISEQPCSIHTE